MESQDEAEEQQTTPTGHPIPVPKREDVFGDLRKVAPPVPPPKAKPKPEK